ncbi:MAG TPA: sigma-70 family RNA polymerase sigma factor [Stellaceae bacterium]|nr:sigma-70 family RNA polymerase sigma factor [Stellaceae bacterium]
MAPFQEALVENLPRLRAFAQFLARDRALAEDLVQETALRALRNSDKFTPGTNMKAWLATILRNQFYNELRTRSRMAAFADMPHSAGQDAEQDAHLDMCDFERAFDALPRVQRDALSLVAARGFSYEEAAAIVGCAQGTVKSRVSRGRSALERALGRAKAESSLT